MYIPTLCSALAIYQCSVGMIGRAHPRIGLQEDPPCRHCQRLHHGKKLLAAHRTLEAVASCDPGSLTPVLKRETDNSEQRNCKLFQAGPSMAYSIAIH